MALTYPPEWKFAADDVEPIPPALLQVLRQQVIQISAGASNKQQVLEAFKEEFASIAGDSSSWSSSYEWAVSDLAAVMETAANNAATFMDAYWSALKSVEKDGLQCPTLEIVNKLLTKYGCAFEIRPPRLLRRGTDPILNKGADGHAAMANPNDNRMSFTKTCGICQGSGYPGLDPEERCVVCHGTGGVLVAGNESEFRRCGPCEGAGYVGYDKADVCKVCRGLGLVRPVVWDTRTFPGSAESQDVDAFELPALGPTVANAAPTLPRACASAVRAVVAHLRTDLVLADTDRQTLRAAVQHFDFAAAQALASKVPVELHSDRAVNGWLLHGARHLLATGRTHRDRLGDIVGRLAQADAEAPHGRVGTALARIQRLGAGSYGTVWKAIRLDTATPVAVKQCHVHDGKPPDSRLVEALRKEAMCLMRLSHPSIPRFVACDFDRRDPYLAMHLVDGVRLGDWLLKNPNVADRETVLSAVLAALEHAHSLGIHHRDLKADNILVAPGPRPFIIDWGGAKTLLPEQQTTTPKFHANIRNSAPECILHVRGNSTTPFPYAVAQDMWSFGAIAYQVLSGRHPFDVPGDPLHTIENVLRLDPAPLPPECGPWGQLVSALLQKDPANRLASCAEVLDTLERAATISANLDDIIGEAIQRLGDRMVLSNETLTGAMAGTNANNFGCDNYHIDCVRYDAVDEVIYFEAQLHFSGDQDQDRMWCGDAFTVRVHGRAVPRTGTNVARWVVDEYHVDECTEDIIDDR